MFSENFGKAKETQQISPVMVHYVKNLSAVPRSVSRVEDQLYDSDEEDDLIVDLSTGSLKPMNMKSYLLLNEVMDGLQRL